MLRSCLEKFFFVTDWKHPLKCHNNYGVVYLALAICEMLFCTSKCTNIRLLARLFPDRSVRIALSASVPLHPLLLSSFSLSPQIQLWSYIGRSRDWEGTVYRRGKEGEINGMFLAPSLFFHAHIWKPRSVVFYSVPPIATILKRHTRREIFEKNKLTRVLKYETQFIIRPLSMQ